ncbi:MAG: SIMPL domain-containing protein [Pseudomonadota bacterium]
MIRFALLLVVFLPGLAAAEDQIRQIVVTGVGSVSAVPDMATVTLGITHEAPTAKEAMAELSKTTTAVLGRIADFEIAESDVQTSSLNLNPVWDQGNTRPPRIRGYMASGMLSVRVRELDTLGGVLDGVTEEGANRLNSLVFGISDTDTLEVQARRSAVASALAKAETLASAAGVGLGPIQLIEENTGGGLPAPTARGAFMESASVTIASGELELQIRVTITFAIAE